MSQRRQQKWRVRLALLVGLGLLALGLLGWQAWQNEIRPVGGSGPVRVEIVPGTSTRQIGVQLQQAGVIRSARLWRLWVLLAARNWQFQAGLYDLDPNQDMLAVAEQIREGQTVRLTVTVPEGWRITQMARFFADQGILPAAAFQSAASVSQFAGAEWLPDKIPALEGYLFPETYTLPLERFLPTVPPEIRAEEMIRAMLGQFARTALPLYQAHQSGGSPTKLSLHEWVTLASIVEREAVVSQERPLIAGVFLRRLQLKMPLGADPTVEYALNIRQTPDRRLTLAEVRTPSPYNTYLNVGLPPGPIASPGLASLKAVLNPTKTDYLYFVARYDGTHVFSKTLAEHEAAQIQIIRQRQSAQP